MDAYEYNLVLNVDYGTSKHTQWFYFQARPAPRRLASVGAVPPARTGAFCCVVAAETYPVYSEYPEYG